MRERLRRKQLIGVSGQVRRSGTDRSLTRVWAWEVEATYRSYATSPITPPKPLPPKALLAHRPRRQSSAQ